MFVCRWMHWKHKYAMSFWKHKLAKWQTYGLSLSGPTSFSVPIVHFLTFDNVNLSRVRKQAWFFDKFHVIVNHKIAVNQLTLDYIRVSWLTIIYNGGYYEQDKRIQNG